MKTSLHLLLLFALLSLIGCGKKETTITNLAALAGGKTFAVPTGTVADQFVLKRFPDAKLQYYNSALDCALAVQGGKADAGVYDLPVLKNIVARNEGLSILPELIVGDRYGFGFRQSDTALKQAVDGVLADLKSNGTYDDMMKRWFPDKGSPAPMPDIPLTGSNGVLRFGTAAVTEPMSFVDARRKVVGFDVEFATRVAQKLGKQLQITDMEFGALLPALIAGKVDMIGAGLSITEERAKRILYSESYYPSGIAVVVRSGGEPAPGGATAKMRDANDVRDKTIGVLLGSVYDTYATRTYPEAKVLEYQNETDMLTALNSSKIDVTFFDQSSVPEMLKHSPALGILAKDIFSFPVGAGFNKDNAALRDQFNAFLKEIRSNGTYDDMVKRWVEEDRMEEPKIESSNKNGVLRAGVIDDAGMPFSLIKDGQLIGFDIELSSRFAAYTGREYQPVPLQFGSLIASIATHKIDIITASMFITEERKKRIDFSDPYYESGVSIIARKERIERAPSAGPPSAGELAGKNNPSGFAVVVRSGGEPAPSRSTAKMREANDVRDKTIGVLLGSTFDTYASRTYPQAKILQYQNITDMLTALNSGKIDVTLLHQPSVPEMLKANPTLGILAKDVYSFPQGAGFNKDNPALRDQFNAFLKEIRSNGTYADMVKRWVEEGRMEMPRIESSNKNGVLRAGVEDDVGMPFSLIKDGQLIGFDIELSSRFAAYTGRAFQPVPLQFGSLIASLVTHKIDIIAAPMSITEERKKRIDFSEPYYESGVSIIARNERIERLAQHAGPEAGPTSKPFFKRAADSFYSNIILEKRYLLILDGLKLTILITIFAALLGTILGGVVCYMRMSRNAFLSRLAAAYISLLRGTPVLVLLMIIYYVVFASVNVNPALVAVIAFGLNFGAYVSEMFRISIQSVDKGQSEAGIAGGFTKAQTFVYIVSPQALRHLLPVYKGEFISLMKMTSIVGYIAVQDLTKASDIIRSRTFDAFFPLIMAAVIYLLLAWLLTWALGTIEVSVDPKRRAIKPLPEAKR